MKIEDLASCDYCGAIYLKQSLVKFNDGSFKNKHYSNLCPDCAEFARKELSYGE